jgi:uncharacterized iron-regulated membrane protein
MNRLADQLPHRDAIRALETKPTRLAKLKSRRKLWLEVHLWLGLTIGAVLVLIGLTGSILVFWQELDAWLNPTLLKVEALAQSQPLAILAENAKTAVPEKTAFGWIEFPQQADQVVSFYYETPSASVPGQTDSWNLYLDPYTGHVVGKRIWYPADYFSGMSLMAFMFKLHYALLLKDCGVPVVGIIGVLLIFSVLTGLIVWWPLTGQWQKALTIKRHSSNERFNFDLHKTAGFYTALVMLAVLLSGVSMNLPDQFKTAVRFFSPLTEPEQFHSSIANGRESLRWDQAAMLVDKAYPEGRLAWMNAPSTSDGVYQVCKTNVVSLNRFVGTRYVLVDQYSGDILKLIDAEQGTTGDVFMQWQWPLHSGKAFGWTGRILVFLCGLACPVLYVTGVIRWLQKRKANRLRSAIG